MRTMVANYGYIQANDEPLNWQADAYIDHPDEILEWILITNEETMVNTQI
jgi:phosphoglycolate phosphatase